MRGLSIVIPCYNEAKSITKSVDRVYDYVVGLTYPCEILLVNDGSKDQTRHVLQELEKRYPGVVKALGYTSNMGKGYAVRYGMEDAIYDRVLFMDADLSTDIRHIDEFYQEGDQYDVLIGVRRPGEKNVIVRQGYFRQLIGFLARKITRALTHLRFDDTQCGFKMFNRHVLQDILPDLQVNRFCFDVEMLYVAQKRGFGIKDKPVTWVNDPDSRVNPIRDGIRFYRDLLRIRRIHR